MINKAQHPKNLPNKEGFKFYGIQIDGTVIECEVYKDDKGLHRIKGMAYNLLKAWLPLYYKTNHILINTKIY